MFPKPPPIDRCDCGVPLPADISAGDKCEHCGLAYSVPHDGLSMTMTMGENEPQADSDDEMLGESLDHFTIINRLGGGGMGTVYLAMDESLQRHVALKVIRRREQGSHSSSETGRVESLLKEARAQARVNHANVVHIYFVSRDERMPYLAMELVPGDTLSRRMVAHRLDHGEVVRIGLQIASALRESAKFDIVHGDIKPGNILLHGEVAKLSDFGLAERVSSSGSVTGRLSGTPNYMAPESCRGEASTFRADMYSFGVMLFEMTFGRLPYTCSDDSIVARLEAHQHSPPEFPASWPREVPESWRPFLERLLQKNPDDRFKDWDSLIRVMLSLRPLKPVTAGRLQRGIAWALDLLILVVAILTVINIFGVGFGWLFPASMLGSTLKILSGLAVPVLVMWWVSRGGSSPGKKLMQLRVVDRHGLRLNSSILARRSIIQFLPIWLLPTATRDEYAGVPDYVWQPLWIVMGIYLLVDILLGIMRRGGRSLHDQMFDTRVVLVGPQNESI